MILWNGRSIEDDDVEMLSFFLSRFPGWKQGKERKGLEYNVDDDDDDGKWKSFAI